MAYALPLQAQQILTMEMTVQRKEGHAGPVSKMLEDLKLHALFSNPTKMVAELRLALHKADWQDD